MVSVILVSEMPFLGIRGIAPTLWDLKRSIPVTLVPLVEGLEVDRPKLVTVDQFEGLLTPLGLATAAIAAVNRLTPS